MTRVEAHMRKLWPRWTLLPAFPFVAWPVYVLALGEVRWELMLMLVLGAVLPYASAATKRLYIGVFPLMLVGLLYDSMRFFKSVGVTAERVHVCDLRAVEAAWFGVRIAGERATVHDWLQAHWHPALDVVAAVPYGTFIGAAALLAIYLYRVDYEAMRRFGAAFLVLNVIGFATYHVYPAAPP